MADVAINDLPAATNVQAADLLVLWQQASNSAKSISGQSFTNWLVAYADGHGGIQSIAKTGSAGTDPVVDTYTITYADTTTDTFTVTNGLKGDTGDQTYVWIAYSTDEPTSDADISIIPDNWMGIYAGLEPTQSNLHYTDYTWYEIKGPKGDGITSIIRTGGDGSPGSTDVYTAYVGNDAVGTFNVYQGMNGDGAVNTVNNLNPDISGNVEIYAHNIERKPLTSRSILLIGDSYNRGVGGTIGQGWGYYFNQQNGTTATIIKQGGGGFAAAAANDSSIVDYPGLTFGEVIAQLGATPSYDLIIAQAGANDANPSRNTGGAAAVTTGVNSFVTNCRSKWPGVEIIIVPTFPGVSPLTTGYSSTDSAIENCLEAIANAAFDNDCRSTSQSWLWMKAKNVTASDNIHLTDAGYQLLAQYITRLYKGWDGVIPRTYDGFYYGTHKFFGMGVATSTTTVVFSVPFLSPTGDIPSFSNVGQAGMTGVTASLTASVDNVRTNGNTVTFDITGSGFTVGRAYFCTVTATLSK